MVKKNAKKILLFTIIALVVIGVIVGVAVGVTRAKGSSGSKPPSSGSLPSGGSPPPTGSPPSGGSLPPPAGSPAPVNCQVSDWTTCSKDCGGGTQTRTIVTEAAYGGTDCSTYPLERACNTQACPYDVNADSAQCNDFNTAYRNNTCCCIDNPLKACASKSAGNDWCGGKGCIASGTDTGFANYGVVNCNTCVSRGLCLSADQQSCIQCPEMVPR